MSELLLGQCEAGSFSEAFSSLLRDQIHQDFITFSILQEDGVTERLSVLDTPNRSERCGIGGNMPTFVRVLDKSHVSSPFALHGPGHLEALQPPEYAQILLREGIRSMCQIPLVFKGKTLGFLGLGSQNPDHFTREILDRLELVTPQLTLALSNVLAAREISSLKEKLADEVLHEEEGSHHDFAIGDIVGSSQALMNVLHQIETVAPSDATVLLLGETGTGKELVARAIHEHSSRQSNPFVKLNCSAIPVGLMESELFGHERGAFTGAIQRKIGRFELAHEGSLFLDEVGDLPWEMQPKLLRAIQEREFERLGSNHTIRVNVRLIAATHQDLAGMVTDGDFRSDLFYRLNVFPILVPALRERKEDIPELVKFFTRKFSSMMGRSVERIPSSVMEALVAWPWPGNIRELQNLIERSVILSPGTDLRVPLAELQRAPLSGMASPVRTLEDVERDHILQALRECKGLVSGPSGAASRLGMKRTTLNYRMKKLGISRDQYQ